MRENTLGREKSRGKTSEKREQQTREANRRPVQLAQKFQVEDASEMRLEGKCHVQPLGCDREQ